MDDEKRPVGRPRKELSERDFAMMRRMVNDFATRDEICDWLGMDENTLDVRLKERGYANFRAFHQKHFGTGKMSLRRAQAKAAILDRNPTMLIFLGKQYLGQRDQREVVHAGEVSHRLTLDHSKLTIEQKRAIADAVLAAPPEDDDGRPANH